MNHINIIGALILAVSSGLLISYSRFAETRGMPQGSFFVSQKAALLGIIVLVISLILAFTSAGFVGIVIALLATWLIPGLVVSSLGSISQVVALVLVPIGLVISLI